VVETCPSSGLLATRESAMCRVHQQEARHVHAPTSESTPFLGRWSAEQRAAHPSDPHLASVVPESHPHEDQRTRRASGPRLWLPSWNAVRSSIESGKPVNANAARRRRSSACAATTVCTSASRRKRLRAPSSCTYRMSMTNRRSPRRFTIRTAMADYLSATTRASATLRIAGVRRTAQAQRTAKAEQPRTSPTWATATQSRSRCITKVTMDSCPEQT
jgi:hypothetical protein